MTLEASILPSLCPNLPSVLYPNPNLSRFPILPKSVGPREFKEGPFAVPRQLRSRLCSSPPPSLQSCKRGSGESRLPQTIQDSIASPPPRPSPRPPPAGFVQRRQQKKKRPREQKGREPRRLAGWPWAARMSGAGGAAQGDCRAIIKGKI